jgi:hypothetical protein
MGLNRGARPDEAAAWQLGRALREVDRHGFLSCTTGK